MGWSGKPVLVVWRDAHHALNESELSKGDYLNRTVGYVKRKPKWTWLAQEVTGSGERRGVSRIPTNCVVSITKLVPQDVVAQPPVEAQACLPQP